MITMRLSFDLIVALATMVLISALLAWASVRVAIRRPKWQSSLLALFAVGSDIAAWVMTGAIAVLLGAMCTLEAQAK